MLERTTTGVLSCGNTKTETRPCGCYRQHTPQTALHNPKTTQTCVGAPAAAAAVCMWQAGCQGGRVWCMAVFRTHEHTARAAALAMRPVPVQCA